MKTLSLLLLTAVAPFAAATPSAKTESPETVTAQIDALIEKDCLKNGIELNQPASDETLLRRLYLDIVGRIPTEQEARSFLEDNSADKRSRLIDQLLDSEGHVNHAFNHWADVLRINQYTNNNQMAAPAYTEFVKEFLRENRPYDAFVRDLVTAEGDVWDNGAIGYYMRDRGMPLDNMATTVQIFLGTRLECAQCHDHPFDKWTQKQFYEMAAFSFGVRSANNQVINNAEYRAAMKGMMGSSRRTSLKSQQYRSAITEIMRPLRYTNVEHNPRRLVLPHDYQYEDAKPGSGVEPATLFGLEAEVDRSKPLPAYAKWLTSKDNPRFTTVIANRMWKQVFGLALIEPLDEITEHTTASNPALMALLEKTMRDVDYDLRAFERILFNTKAYQREAFVGEIVPGLPFHFQGPVLRRMTAEQIWDSFITFVRPDPDALPTNPRTQLRGGNYNMGKSELVAKALRALEPEEFIEGVGKVVAEMSSGRSSGAEFQKKIVEAREAGDTALAAKLMKEAGNTRNEARRLAAKYVYTPGLEKLAAAGELPKGVDLAQMASAMRTGGGNIPVAGMSSMMSMEGQNSMAGGGMSPQQAKTEAYARSLGLPADTPIAELKAARARQMQERVAEARAAGAKDRKSIEAYMSFNRRMDSIAQRAANLAQPAPPSHFLREFGQSDRDLIENASDEASLPQALQLLNGRLAEGVTSPYSVLFRGIRTAEGSRAKVEAIYLSVLSRYPTDDEYDLLVPIIEKGGQEAIKDVLSSLLNTQQFLFVQ